MNNIQLIVIYLLMCIANAFSFDWVSFGYVLFAQAILALGSMIVKSRKKE